MKRIAFSSIAALGLHCFATPAYAQQLQAAGISAGFNVARLKADRYAFRYNSVLIDPFADQSNDETGNSITLFGRWKIGQTGWYVQPELGYMSTLETPVLLSNATTSFPYSNSRIRRLDARLLGGYQSGPLRLFAGPSIGYYLYNSRNFTSPDPEVQAVMSALDANPKRWQASVQAGAGVTLGRVDLNVRYEWGLSPYKESFPAPGESAFMTRKLQQLVLEGGFQLYKRSTPK
ncbi:PorT family protein [Hymenobacter sp. BT188]|uniref:outer membrane beta-barrel protein n=1 Tax=Hymenobacter sp. BT188 TaxID=2763504 RepID=UPI001651597B|nr:outer membrane beta-barrel protein [Hymenobacter sp. BT188]MBC6605610.1 PorT family protein [Hymenobacter sp. BT188]